MSSSLQKSLRWIPSKVLHIFLSCRSFFLLKLNVLLSSFLLSDVL